MPCGKISCHCKFQKFKETIVECTRVFSDEQEQALVAYLLHAADIYYGLTPTEVRRFAYLCAVTYKLKFPTTWTVNEMAGKDWFSGFRKRHNELSIRKPQATSLARATAFNRTTVDEFFDNLSTVMERHKFEPQDIYNVDKTGITKVQTPDRVKTRRGKKQVGALVSAERGTLVTMAIAINATGNSTPPIFIFPRKTSHISFVMGLPAALEQQTVVAGCKRTISSYFLSTSLSMPNQQNSTQFFSCWTTMTLTYLQRHLISASHQESCYYLSLHILRTNCSLWTAECMGP